VQRQHLQARQVRLLGQRVGGVPDLPLAAEEDQDVPASLGAQLAKRVADALRLVFRLVTGAVRVGQRAVAHLDRVHAPRHLDPRRASGALLAWRASGALLAWFASGALLAWFASGAVLA